MCVELGLVRHLRRTGTLFAMEQMGVAPDLTTFAKSIAGGFPLAGVTGRAEVMDAVAPGGLGGTYAGNAIETVQSATFARGGAIDKVRVPLHIARGVVDAVRPW